jgi:hypothetical protein
MKQLLKNYRNPKWKKKREPIEWIRRKVEASLREEPIKLWNQKPEEERFKRMEFFGGRRLGKREEFNAQYINERFEERVKKVFQVNEKK